MRCRFAIVALFVLMAACLTPGASAAGSLTGSSAAVTATQAVNLTTLGTADWAHWGTTTAASFDHKAATGTTPVGLLSNYTALGTGTVTRYTDNLTSFTWNNGTPSASVTNTPTGVYLLGNTNGFRLSAPADTTRRTLTVYVGGKNSAATLTAHLSDGAAADFVSSAYGYNKPGNADGSHYYAVYTLTYSAATAGQTLSVSWVQASSLSGGNVTLQAAALAVVPPLSPTGVVATAVSSTQISLTWTAAAGAASYQVKRGTVSGGPYTVVGAPTTASFSDTGLTPATRYYYVVTAVNAGGESAASTEAPKTTYCAAPTNLTATAGTGQIGLTWTASTGATSYSLYRGTAAGGEGTTAYKTGLTGTSYTDTAVTAGTPYYYVLKAVNAVGASASSNEAQATVSGAVSLLSVTVTPTSVTGGTSSTGKVTLSGNAPTGGVSVSLSSSSASASVPASVIVAAGSASATFPVTTTSVTAVTSATLTATYSGTSKTATLTITPEISLTAAATGANKVTLYWNGIAGALGYNIYRSTASGGSYTRIASNVATADNGPGLVNAFMYSDAAGLTTGTEYFYVVWAVQSSVETVQSNESSAMPSSSAIPWDSGNAAQIIAQVSTSVASALEPDIDPDTGDQYPATVGILTVCAPDGVLYQGNYTDGSPAAAYPPSAYFDSDSNTIIYGDGTAAAAPAEGDDDADAPQALPAGSDQQATTEGISPNFQISDLYNYSGNNTGIWRKVLSVPGFWGAAGTCGLPNLNDSNSVVLAVFAYPTDSKNTGNYSDSGDIYFGGTVNYTGPIPIDPKTGRPAPYNDRGLDIGLQASAGLASTSVPGWVPVINPSRKLVQATGKTRRIVTGVTLGAFNGSLKGRKIYAINETRMQFITPQFPNIADQTVALHIAKPLGGVAGGDILVAPFVNNATSLGTPVSYQAATLVYYSPGWRKTNANNSTGNNLFSIKRVNSIAQSLSDKDHQTYPQANGPSESNIKSFRLDSSAIRGAYWGSNGDSRGVELNTNGSWTPWTDDNSQSLHSGAYPNSKYGGYGYVTWTNHNGFTWETNINLKANHTLP